MDGADGNEEDLVQSAPAESGDSAPDVAPATGRHRVGLYGLPRNLMGVHTRFVLADAEHEILCVRFSPDDLYLAAACSNGSIVVYNALTGKHTFTLAAHDGDNLPLTQLRWRSHNFPGKTKHVLVAVGADGSVRHWHVPSKKLLHEVIEEGNQLFCLDFTADGTRFATSGRRREVNIYDEQEKRLVQVMRGGDIRNTPGHSNRVFALKCHPTMRSVLVTGGWDSTVQFWDQRAGHAIRAIIGPHICGDALDVSKDGNVLLTGSWRTEHQLQLWDFASGTLLETIPWHPSAASPQPCLVYAAQFSRSLAAGTSLLAAGGSTAGGGGGEARLLDCSISGGVSAVPVGSLGERACYTLDFSSDGSMLATAGADGCPRVVSILGS